MRRITVSQPNKRIETEDGTPPPKITKLAINMENEEPQYEYQTKVRCYICNIEVPKDESPKVKT